MKHLKSVVAVATLLAAATAATAQPASTPPAIPLGGGLLGGAAVYVPNIPLSPAAQTNLAAQSLATGGDGTWQSQISYAHGMEFVTINVPNNPLRPGVTDPNAIGSGRVTQAFAMSRFEAPNALWRQFVGAVSAVRASGQTVPFAQDPEYSGSAADAFLPVGGVSWRTAAIFCNWLHNDRVTARASFMSGAYDVNTFGGNGNGFTDQLTASPGARFRLPTLNEHIAASHFDPNGNGANQPRWWNYNTTSDTVPVYGPPGAIMARGLAQANAGGTASWPAGSPLPFAIPLGAYAETQSPWGLLDMAGGTSEWTEGVFFRTALGGYDTRFFEGSARARASAQFFDQVGFEGAGDLPSLPLPEYGLRVIMVIPAPSAGGVVLVGLLTFGRRVRRGS